MGLSLALRRGLLAVQKTINEGAKHRSGWARGAACCCIVDAEQQRYRAFVDYVCSIPPT